MFDFLKKRKKEANEHMATTDEKEISKAKEDIAEKGEDSQTERDRTDESVARRKRIPGTKILRLRKTASTKAKEPRKPMKNAKKRKKKPKNGTKIRRKTGLTSSPRQSKNSSSF